MSSRTKGLEQDRTISLGQKYGSPVATQEDKTQHMASAGQQMTQHIVLSSNFMFRTNGTPRAQGRAGAVPLNLAQCLTQGGGESGDRSKGHDLLFSADYADYADYCMRLAWAMRRSGASQFCKASFYLSGRQGGVVP